MDYYGQLDFTVLCRLWRQHKELFQMVEFKDGPHALLKANFNKRQQPDEHGNTHYLKANCKKTEQREGVNYYLSNGFKPSQNSQSQQQAAPQPAQNTAIPSGDDDLPFDLWGVAA